MLNQFYIIKPEKTINMIANPSPKFSLTDWSAVDNGLYGDIDTTYLFQRRSAASAVMSPASYAYDGLYYDGAVTPLNLVNGEIYTFSVDVLGVFGVPYRVYFANTSGTLLGSAETFIGTGWWQRVEVTYTAASTAEHRVYVTKNNSPSTSDFYVDGLQVEHKAYATTHCDGSVDGCFWNGLPYQSTSVRPAGTRIGGRKVYLDTEEGAYLISQNNTGMPTMTTLITRYGGQDGAHFEGQTTGERVFSLAYSIADDGQAAWHAKRAEIINLIKRNTTPYQTYFPMIMGYTGAGGDETEIGCVYEDGLNLNEGKLDIEAAPLRFLAPDPFWYATARKGALLTHVNTFATTSAHIMTRNPEGVWSEIVGTAAIRAMVVSPDGQYLYVGGVFTTIGASSVSAIGIARYNFAAGTWSHLGAAFNTLNGDVNTLAFGPDGRLWIGGDFVNVQGIATADYIVVYNPTTNTYATASGTGGANAAVYAIAIDSSYRVYAGGGFTAIGASSADYVAYLNPATGTWTHLGSGPTAVVGGNVTQLQVRPNRDIVIGGGFTSVDGVTNTKFMARYDFASSTWKSIVSGLTVLISIGWVFSDPFGNIYMTVGQDTLNGVTINTFAKWNGSTWIPMMNGIATSASGGGVKTIANIGRTGRFIAGGVTYSASILGFTPRDNIVEWTGTSWVPFGIEYSGSADSRVITTGPDGSLYIAQFNTISQVSVPGQTVVTASEHNADCYPVITIKSSTANTANGTLSHIKNETTGDSIYFNLGVMPGEIITMDFRPDYKTMTSNFRGNILDSLVRGSNYGKFHLAPGDNTISVFLTNGTYTVDMEWTERFWSDDNTGNG